MKPAKQHRSTGAHVAPTAARGGVLRAGAGARRPVPLPDGRFSEWIASWLAGMRCAALLACCFAALLSACTRPAASAAADEPAVPASGPGKLLIIGGGLHSDNVDVWRAFADAAGPTPRIGIIPTASALPEAGASTALDIRTHVPRAAIDIIDVREGTAHLAHDPAIVERITACNVLWFTGGDQSRITAVFRPGGRDTPACAAVRKVLHSGGLIAGTSAGAAMMSDPMITGGAGDDALRQALGVPMDAPPEGDQPPAEGGNSGRSPGIGPGMGLFPYGLTDQHFLRRGRLGRLSVALQRTGLPRGYGIADNRAILVDLADHSIHPLGEDAVLLVDVSSATAAGDAILNIRLSLLSGGDRIDGRSGLIQFAADAGPLPEATPREVFADPFAPDAVKHAIHTLRADPRVPVALTGPDDPITLTFTARGRHEPVRLDVTTSHAQRARN